VNPFGRPGQWLKSALHTHSTVSDGTLSPDALVQAYVEAGFDLVSITDHWRLASPTPRDDVVLLPGAELGFDMLRPTYPGQSGEFLVYGLDHVPDDPGWDRANWYVNEEEHYEVRTFPSLTTGMEWVAGMDAVAYVAHPYWNHLPQEELTSMTGFAGIEVFNGSAHVECGRGDSSPWWDTLLAQGRTVYGIATDDQHYPLFELGLAWTMLRVSDPTPQAAVEALRTGAAYFSEGPTLHEVTIVDDGIEVACSPCRSVLVQSEEEWGTSVNVGRAGRRQGRILQVDESGLITRAVVEASGERRYRRVTVIDAAGRRAWTNPL
jgi:hypothetical protein